MAAGETAEQAARLLALAMQAPALKRTPRMGWLMRGVAPGEVESVAGHTAGVSLIALMLAEQIDPPLDRGRLLSICLLHDLAEAVVGDLPWPAARYLDPGVKAQTEARALADMLDGLPFAAGWQAMWLEYEEGASPEALLVKDADRLDMLLQAAAYQQAGRRGLEEFWVGADDERWHFAQSEALYVLARDLVGRT